MTPRFFLVVEKESIFSFGPQVALARVVRPTVPGISKLVCAPTALTRAHLASDLTRMPSNRQIAKDWKCRPSWVDRCVKRGCPTDSFEAARLWRQAHASSRPPTHPKAVARQITEELDDDSPEARECRKRYPADKPDGTIVPSKSLEDALLHAIQLENEAFRLANEAIIEGKDSRIQIRLAIHNKAQENRVKIESMIREELESRKELIPFDQATEIFRRGLDIVLRRLKRFPQEKAAACNPQNPVHASGILESGIDAIIAEAQGQYAPAAGLMK
jgi:hypothetical protein